MKYELNLKGGKHAKCKLIVKRHGKTFIEKVKIKDVIDDKDYDKKFEKRMDLTLGKGSCKKLMKMLDKDFEL